MAVRALQVVGVAAVAQDHPGGGHAAGGQQVENRAPPAAVEGSWWQNRQAGLPRHPAGGVSTLQQGSEAAARPTGLEYAGFAAGAGGCRRRSRPSAGRGSPPRPGAARAPPGSRSILELDEVGWPVRRATSRIRRISRPRLTGVPSTTVRTPRAGLVAELSRGDLGTWSNSKKRAPKFSAWTSRHR